jgi:hypothetical protein
LALEGRFSKELTERFPKVVTRPSSFDWLALPIRQFEKHHVCYLYGFFRAAVLVAATAVEARLKSVGAVEDRKT